MRNKSIVWQEEAAVLAERISKTKEWVEEKKVLTTRRNIARGQNMNREQTEQKTEPVLDKE